MTRAGVGLDEILRFSAERRWLGPSDTTSCMPVRALLSGEPFLERFTDRGLVIEVRANRMPDGGIVTTFTDITPASRPPKRWSASTRRWSGGCASAPRN